MADSGAQCLFCHLSSSVDIAGEILAEDEVTVHQHCLYFASGLPQNSAGEVGDAISGFLLKDIRQELRRGLKIKCSGCHQPGGFVGCAVRTCNRAGHFPCLHRLGYTFQYSGEFRTYCPQHSPTQPIVHGSDHSLECCICLAQLSSQDTIYCPCCLTTFHKPCVQKQAWTAGSYHMRCAVCKDADTYCAEMLRMGIDIPERDAQWEIGTHYASEDSKYCHAHMCLCPEGRAHSTQIGQYRMRKCRTCGQCRGHVECLRGDKTSECQDCSIMGVDQVDSGKFGETGTSKMVRVNETKIPPVSVEASCKPLSTAGKSSSAKKKVLVLSLKRLSSKDISLINSHK